MEIENDNPNVFADFVFQSAQFVNYSKQQLKQVADISEYLSEIDTV